MIKFILGATLIALSCSTAVASDTYIEVNKKIDMGTFKTRLLSNQEMIFIEEKDTSSERVDKLKQTKGVFTPWSSLIDNKKSS